MDVFMMILGALMIGFIAGLIVAYSNAISALFSGADTPGRTLHKFGERFYYIVPEREYCELTRQRWRQRFNVDCADPECEDAE